MILIKFHKLLVHVYNFSSLRKTGDTTKALNLGSYNYLGFAENVGPCAEASVDAVHKYGLGGCSPRHEYGKLNKQ